LSAVLLEWNDIQKGFKAPHHVSRRDRLRWIAVCLRCIVFVGYSGAPFWNRAFNLRLRAACRTIEVAQITWIHHVGYEQTRQTAEALSQALE
jgi:hypothetical protein